MKTKLSILAAASLLLLSACSEFTKEEAYALQQGRIVNAAIASEFEDTFQDYWNETIVEETNKMIENHSEAIVNETNTNMLFTEGLLSYAAERSGMNKIDALEYTVNELEGQYKKLHALFVKQINEKGIKTVSAELDSIMKLIEKGDQEWIYGEPDENGESKPGFAVDLGEIIAHPKYGFHPETEYYKETWELEKASWLYPLSTDIEASGEPNNSVYYALKLMQKWIADRAQKKISVDYCVGLEDALNSYLVGYSNQRAFNVTFPRNSDDTRVIWKEIEYDVAYAGESLLDD